MTQSDMLRLSKHIAIGLLRGALVTLGAWAICWFLSSSQLFTAGPFISTSVVVAVGYVLRKELTTKKAY